MRIRRHLVSRWALGLGMIVACGLLVRAATVDTPSPTESSLVARGPYLQRTSSIGTVVRWRTTQPTVGTIYFGPTWGDLVDSGTRLLNPGLSFEHEFEIGGLTPGTRYYYAVASGASILAGNDEEHFFETHPAPGPPRNTRIWIRTTPSPLAGTRICGYTSATYRKARGRTSSTRRSSSTATWR